MNTAMVDAQPTRPIAKLGLVGEGGVVHLPASCCSFLMDASEYIEDGLFAVPFSVAALRVVEAFCSTPIQVIQAAMARPTGSRFDEMSDIEQQLMSIDFELLFEVLRAANYLGCADLLKLASRAVANLLGSLRDDPEHLAAVLGLSRGSSSPRTSSSLASVRPWSTVWSALVNEPVLEPPDDIDEAQSLTALDEDHRIRDEDALELCLLECDAATLRQLKGLSLAWTNRARAALTDKRWLSSQTTIDLDWALGGSGGLEAKRWDCAASLILQMPQLTSLKLFNVQADLKQLASANGFGHAITLQTLRRAVHETSLPRSTASSPVPDEPRAAFQAGHATRASMPWGGVWEQQPPSPTRFGGATPNHAKRTLEQIGMPADLKPATLMRRRNAIVDGHAGRVGSRMACAREALTIAAAIWALAHNRHLISVDLAGVLSKVGPDGNSPAWPLSAVYAIARAVRFGAPMLQTLRLSHFHVPIYRLRREGLEPLPDPDRVPWTGQVLDLNDVKLCTADVVLAARAASDLSHVLELCLSSNDLGDAGFEALIGEIALHGDAEAGPQEPRRLGAGEQMQPWGASRLRGGASVEAMRPEDMWVHKTVRAPNMLLCNLTWLGVDDIDIGDDAVRSLVSTLASGAFARLEQFSAVGNRIGDDGLAELCWVAEEGYLARLIHLNLGGNQIGDRGCASLGASLAQGAFPQLLHLSLARNNVGDEGIAAIADATFASTFVARPTYLGLGANLIGNPGTVALARAISYGTGLSNLQGIWVADNHHITDTGAVALANAIGYAGKMTEMFVYGTNMKGPGIDAFITAIRRLPSFRKAVLGRVSPHIYDLVEIMQAQLRRTTGNRDLIISAWHDHKGPLKDTRNSRFSVVRGMNMRSALAVQRGGNLTAANHMGGIQNFNPHVHFGNANIEGMGWM